LYRGGTSRGLFFSEQDFSYPRPVREAVLLRAFGSPDPRQIDGLGGANSLTSKAMIVGPSDTPDADVQMHFAQVGVDTDIVDWGGNCGNMTSAVGPFAIESGLVKPVEPVTTVRIVSVNTGIGVHAHVPVRDGRVEAEGDYTIPGVPGTAARIDLEWLEPGGSTTGKVLPTGKPVDTIELSDGRKLNVSILDAANPVVFCEARDVGLRGTEEPAELESCRDATSCLEEIRSIAAEILGIAPSRDVATAQSPGLPKVACVTAPADYHTTGGRREAGEHHDLQARLMSMQKPHRAYGVTSAVCTAVAALVDGTLVNANRRPVGPDPNVVRIANPYGVMDVTIAMEGPTAEPHILSATVGRTARLIMSGSIHIPRSLLHGS
jgi:2-methylaconitate cis-trans-isomerase PrpF